MSRPLSGSISAGNEHAQAAAIDAAPVASQERVQVLDVLRGFAILGMWAVNMTIDVGWIYRIEFMPMTATDSAVVVIVKLLMSGKFYTIFCFLFGIGALVQIERVQARGGKHVAFYLRRSFGLLLIASVATAATVYAGVLVDYAILGVALLLFADRSPRTILIAALVCFAISFAFVEVAGGVDELGELRAYAQEQGMTLEAAIAAQEEADAARGIAREPSIRSAPFLRQSRALLSNSFERYGDWSYYPESLGTLGLMLLGLYVARRGAVWKPDVRQAIASRALPWLLGAGATAAVVAVVMNDFGFGSKTSLAQRILWPMLQDPVGAVSLGLGYAALVVLLFEKESWHRLLARLAPVGRMALTCYLLSNLLSSFINFGWGLGQFGELMPAAGLLIVAILSPLLILACTWWLDRFRFGPIEWLWRSLTYGSLQKMKVRGGP